MEFNFMLCSSVEKPFDSPDFIFEPKLDGARAMMVTDTLVLDGEIVINGESNIPDISLVQQRIHLQNKREIQRKVSSIPAYYQVFDILRDRFGRPVYAKDILSRKKLLDNSEIKPAGNIKMFSRGGNNILSQFPELKDPERIKLVPWLLGDGKSLFDNLVKAGYEGIVAKRIGSPYMQGKRNEMWRKCRPFREGRFVIIGAIKGEGWREEYFGSIILAKKSGSKLVHIGEANVPSISALEEVSNAIDGLKIPKSVVDGVDVDKEVLFWVTPKVEVEVTYYEVGKGGKLRFPKYKRLARSLSGIR
jgi:bifunctional non-homologous end joining protein LigD